MYFKEDFQQAFVIRNIGQMHSVGSLSVWLLEVANVCHTGGLGRCVFVCARAATLSHALQGVWRGLLKLSYHPAAYARRVKM